LSPASDNPAVLADISGTVIESNAVFFEGAGFFLRPKGAVGDSYGSLSGLTLLDFTNCTDGGGGVGADCFGAPRPAVRYDSPTWGGFRFETSYGTVQTIETPEHNFWDVAVFYTADWNSIKLSAAYAYTHEEESSGGNCNFFNGVTVPGCGDDDLHQVGASIMHKPSGLGVYGLWQEELVDGKYFAPYKTNFSAEIKDSEVWYVKPFWRKAWSPMGATTLFGEYGQYNDQFGGIAGANLCQQSFFFGLPPAGQLNGSNLCPPNTGFGPGFTGFPIGFITDSEVQRWGLGVVQEIDSAAMHLFARWQHQEASINLVTCQEAGGNCFTGNLDSYTKVKGNFDNWDLFQVGGIIFF
jgi:hypothetical protein